MRPGLVCVHVGREGAAICLAAVDPPQHQQDSGWSLACGSAGHEKKDWMVVDLDRYLTREAPLSALRGILTEGMEARRRAAGMPWVVGPSTPEPEEPAEAA